MLPEELEQVFGSVTQLYSRNLSDAFRRLPPQVCRANQIPECSCLSRMHEIAVQEAITLDLMHVRVPIRRYDVACQSQTKQGA